MESARLLNNNQRLTLSEDAASLINDALRALITEIIANIMVSLKVRVYRTPQSDRQAFHVHLAGVFFY